MNKFIQWSCTATCLAAAILPGMADTAVPEQKYPAIEVKDAPLEYRQFEKVEIIQIVHPDKSDDTLNEMVAHVENLLISLGLQYRILRLCGGDMGFAAAITYDFEVYSTAQERWLEISSVSNFETFQANRLKLRFKDKDGKNQLAHTLNGSSLALPRVLAGILENYQTPEGIIVPEVLRKYTGFDIIN